MEPIIVKSQISLKQLYNINWFILLRKRIMWVLGFVVLLMLYSLSISRNTENDTPWFTIGFVIYFILLPLFITLAVRRNYKKIPSMSEPKVYEFLDDLIKVSGPTLSATMAWSIVEKIYERKSDFLAITSNGKGVHYLPKAGFASDIDIEQFKALIKSKGIKTNIK
jgi:hypothetical protein